MQQLLHCIYFIHLSIASHSTSLSEAFPITALSIDELARRSASGNCKLCTDGRKWFFIGSL